MTSPDPTAGTVLGEEARTALTLLHEALLLRMYGERPPGAPADDPHAETWPEWESRAEAFLRSVDGER